MGSETPGHCGGYWQIKSPRKATVMAHHGTGGPCWPGPPDYIDQVPDLVVRGRGLDLLERWFTVSAWTTLFPQPAQPFHGYALLLRRTSQGAVGQLLQG